MFKGNTASQQGGVSRTANFLKFVNCVFDGNTSDYDGIASTDLTAESCTFYNNTASTLGDISYATALDLKNCIFFGGSHKFDSETGRALYCDNVDGTNLGGLITVGCISGNPLFASTTYNDPLYLRLALGSPCIDTGTFDATVPTRDAAGNPRPAIPGSRVDMGAYEFQGTDVNPPIVQVIQPTGERY